MTRQRERERERERVTDCGQIRHLDVDEADDKAVRGAVAGGVVEGDGARRAHEGGCADALHQRRAGGCVRACVSSVFARVRVFLMCVCRVCARASLAPSRPLSLAPSLDPSLAPSLPTFLSLTLLEGSFLSPSLQWVIGGGGGPCGRCPPGNGLSI